MMDNEIRTLKEKIIELNVIIENLRNKISEFESKQPPIKSANEQFCELYKNFSKKKIIPHEIDMIVGMYLTKQEKKYEKKYNNLVEVQERLKKRIADLTGQLHIFKYGKKMPSDLEEHKIEFELNENIVGDNDIENKSQIIEDNTGSGTFRKYMTNDTKTNGLSRIIDVGSTTKQVGNTVITTKTTQISYKRKRGGNKK